MHLYAIARGIKHDLDRCIHHLSATFLPMKNSGGKVVQVGVRPIAIYEIVYPEEHHELMCNTVFKWGDGNSQHKRHNKFTAIIRKMLGVDKLEFTKNAALHLPAYNENIEWIGIGQKEDRKFDGPEAL